MSIEEKQIQQQIEGRTDVRVHFADGGSCLISLFEQGEGRLYIEPSGQVPRLTSQKAATELEKAFTGEQQYNTDPDVIRTDLARRVWLGRYYDCLPEPEKAPESVHFVDESIFSGIYEFGTPSGRFGVESGGSGYFDVYIHDGSDFKFERAITAPRSSKKNLPKAVYEAHLAAEQTSY